LISGIDFAVIDFAIDAASSGDREARVKKFTIHLDAVLVLILLAAGLVAFVIFQHREQQRLFQQNIDLTWELQNGQTRIAQLERRLTACRNDRASAPHP